MPTSKSCTDFRMQNTFKAGNMHQNMTWWIFTQQFTFKVFCKVWMRTYNFQSVLHADANTWADAGPLKAKYPENAVNFKHD